jgi:hypothetical protein
MKETFPVDDGIVRYHVYRPITDIDKRFKAHAVARESHELLNPHRLYHLHEARRQLEDPRYGPRVPDIVIVNRYRLVAGTVSVRFGKIVIRQTSEIFMFSACIGVKTLYYYMIINL